MMVPCSVIGCPYDIDLRQRPAMYGGEPVFRCGNWRAIHYTKFGTIKEVIDVKVSETYQGSNNINTEDMDIFDKDFTIKDVSLEEYNEKDKFKLEFLETEKSFVLNKTNAEHLAQVLGDETDGWIGAKIRFQKTKVKFEGKLTDALRFDSIKK